MLWDIRKSQGTLKPEPVIELDGHMGPVNALQNLYKNCIPMLMITGLRPFFFLRLNILVIM